MAATKNNSSFSSKTSKHHEGLLLLIAVPILVITGFMIFWLRENYMKEREDLEFRTNVIFKETVRKLQAKKLNLDKVFNDSTGKIRVEVMDDNPMRHPAGLTDVLNDVTIRVNDSLRGKMIEMESRPNIFIRKGDIPDDSLRKLLPKKGNMVISMNESYSRDSLFDKKFTRRGPPGEIFRFLYSVDSLQDSLKVKEIDSACRAAFDKEDINVTVTVSRISSPVRVDRFPSEDQKILNRVTIGFAHPTTYEMNLGNSFGYVVKKLASPILFSLFLVGVTVLAFTLLYRNLLRQRKLTEIKNEFISNITHELKTPIATVGVAIEALRNFNAINDPERTKEYLDISQNELQRLSLLVDKVLKLSMFEKKEIELKYEQLNLTDIVNEVVSSMKLQIEKHHANVSINAEGNTSLNGDKLHLLSVVFNLLDNALKYGNGNIAVKFDIKEKEGDVELSVVDNGIGISQEYKDKVFEKFFRVPLGNTHNTKGYGLGLSYVAHVIQKHKGKIEVESQSGLGSKFIITLPKTA